MRASLRGHTETLALLLANKADVHAVDQVIITLMFQSCFTLKIETIYLCNVGFSKGTHRNTCVASGQ